MEKRSVNRRIIIRLLSTVICLLLVIPTVCSQQNTILESEARRLLDYFMNKESEKVMEMLTIEIAQQIPDGQLEEIADGLENQLGEFLYAERVIFESAGEYEIVMLVCRFEKMELALRVVFDQEVKVAGFNFVPAPAIDFSPPPDYADSTRFTESEFAIDCGDIVLPAKLTMPVEGSGFPVVILVHGSGPHDSDETIGPNKPFRDLAWGLSSKGVAVLRYEKRTLKHGNTLDRNSFTIWDETGRDAVAAIQKAGNIQGTDPDRIFLLGHSLGGMLAPAIAEKSPQLAGIIIMAGNSRPLQNLVPEQYEYLMSAEGQLSDEQQKVLEELKEQAGAISENRLDGLTYRETLLNLPPAYWEDLNNYNQSESAAGISQRILVLQGERDYQVTMKDYHGWKTALQDHPDAGFISYPRLNHLMMDGTGDPNPLEYFDKNNIDRKVITDIAEWIQDRP